MHTRKLVSVAFVLVVLTLSGLAAEATDMFLIVPGVQGEAGDPQFARSIVVHSASWGQG